MLETIVRLVGIVVSVIRIIVMIINIVQTSRLHKHQKSSRADQS